MKLTTGYCFIKENNEHKIIIERFVVYQKIVTLESRECIEAKKEYERIKTGG